MQKKKKKMIIAYRKQALQCHPIRCLLYMIDHELLHKLSVTVIKKELC